MYVFLHLFLLYTCAFGLVHAEVRRQLLGFISPLRPYGFHGSISGPKAWQQSPLPAEPAHCPLIFSFCGEQFPGSCYSIRHHIYNSNIVPRGNGPQKLVQPLSSDLWSENFCEKLVNHSFSSKEKPSQKTVSFHFICIHAHVHTWAHRYALFCFVSSFIVCIQCV